MPCVLANRPRESRQRGDGQRLPGPKMATAERSAVHRQVGRQRESHSPLPRAVRLSHAGHCGQLSGCPTAGQGCPAPVGCTAFRNAFFGGTPASLDGGTDGPSLLDPGASSPKAGPASAACGSGAAPAHKGPAADPPAICSGADLCAPQNVRLIKAITGGTHGAILSQQRLLN